jgi:hypothetical protein
MKKSLLALVALSVTLHFTAGTPAAEGVPAGYELVYEQDFDSPAALNDFRFTDPRAWKLGDREGDGTLELHGGSKYSPPHRSPGNIALLSTLQLESFVIEAKLLQTGREYGHRDMCIFFGFVDPSKYYYAHIATRTDPHAHNIFIVNQAPRTKISTKTTQGVQWGQNVWHRVRVARDAKDGTIRVYYDDMGTPIMEATDRNFPTGYVGFGSFDDTGMVDSVKIWAPGAKSRRASKVFAVKPLQPIEEEPDVTTEEFRPLFDGKTLEGWKLAEGKASGKMKFEVDQGAVLGTCVQGQPNGFLRTENLFGDFIFTCEVKFEVPGNSGIQFRSEQRENDGRVFGYQCEIDPSDRRYSAGIYDEARRGWLFPLWGEAYKKAREAFQMDKWNRFTIQTRGRRLQTWVNGVPCSDYTDTDPENLTPRGFIALQVHGGRQGQIRWRGLKIRELASE